MQGGREEESDRHFCSGGLTNQPRALEHEEQGSMETAGYCIPASNPCVKEGVGFSVTP